MSDDQKTVKHDPDKVLARLDLGLAELENSVRELREEVKKLRNKQQPLGETPSTETREEGS